MTPSTPLEELEERRNETIEFAKIIEEVEELCAKAVEQVSQTWEALIDDEELEKFTKQLRIVEIEVNELRNEMKKLSLVEKMAKYANMKRLQK